MLQIERERDGDKGTARETETETETDNVKNQIFFQLPILNVKISQLQFGFVPDKGTRNAIFTLSMLAERCIEMQKDLYLCFIDYSKAFDKVETIQHTRTSRY